MLLQDGQRIVFTGDSVTDSNRKRPVGEGLWDGVGNGYVRLLHTIINTFHPEEIIRISNTGVSGNNILDLEARWQQDVMELKPDWVSIMIGINDVWRRFDEPDIFEGHISHQKYEEVYDNLIKKTLPHVKGMILMAPYFMEPNKQDPMRMAVEEMGAAVKRLADKYHLCYVDTQKAFDNYFQYRHPDYVAWDRVHPNQVGAMILARAWLDAVGFEWGL